MLNQYWQNITAAVITSWNIFWFKPLSTKSIAIFRIFFGLLLFQYALLLVSDLFVWFGKHSIVSCTSINDWQPAVQLNILNVFPDNDVWLCIVFSALFIASVFLTLGFMTRASAVLAFVCLLSFQTRNFLIVNSGDVLMRQLCLWLVFSAAGKSCSIDCQLANLKPQQTDTSSDCNSEAEPWAQRLMQINVVLAYAQTFFKKIFGPVWQNGTAVYFSSHFYEMQHLPIKYIFDHLWTIHLLTWATLAIEFSLGFLIWFKPIRYYVIALGVIMHLVIDWSMLIPQFEWLMITSYILFIEPHDLDRLLAWFSKLFSALIKKTHFS